MIFKSHRAEAKAARADVDASELFGFAQNVEDVMRKDVRRWGIRHARYRKIRKSYRALIHELSMKLDAENDLGLRPVEWRG